VTPDAQQLRERAERAEAERDEIIESYRELRDKCNDAYLQRDAQQVRANTAETKVAEWRDASFVVDAQLRLVRAERDGLLEEVKDYEDSGLTEGRARYWRERAERAEAALARVWMLLGSMRFYTEMNGIRLFDEDEIRAAIEGDRQ
jgi:chromosome segregation ATPase